MNKYKQCLAKMNGRPSKKVANNTYLHKVAGGIALKLHETDILVFREDGSCVANSGGWKTPTTKSRLNCWMPFGFRLWAKRGVWYWGGASVPDGKPVMFTDGDTIGARGALHAQADGKAEKKALALRRRVLAYAKLCAEAVPLDQPDGGDSWFESMVVVDGPNKGKTLGDANKDTSRFHSYMEEGYVVPSLVLHAMREAGNTDFIISMAFKQAGQNAGWLEGLVKNNVKKAVAKYLFLRLGLVSGGGCNATGFRE